VLNSNCTGTWTINDNINYCCRRRPTRSDGKIVKANFTSRSCSMGVTFIILYETKKYPLANTREHNENIVLDRRVRECVNIPEYNTTCFPTQTYRLAPVIVDALVENGLQNRRLGHASVSEHAYHRPLRVF